MFEYKVIKKVDIPTISEATLKEMLIEAITKRLPLDVIVNDVNFTATRKGKQEIVLDVDAQFADADEEEAEPVKAKKPVKKVEEAKPEPVAIPELPEEEVALDRDGVPNIEPSFEAERASLIDEVLAEDPETEEDSPLPSDKAVEATGAKSLADMFKDM
ncbi:hypothetical protein NVP1238A_42 [Vibrio phage 1.238.A._10N.261.52.F10]|uniref:Uncharacterized protein n=1 Tax=Vibrio phage 1.238.A._10N.261.52.F10 TaxID=1881231 RepID=A0A2I7RUP7_9CAUD|nr:hypothetical protein KNT79_gp42 [Vibrio phage 1.238.A._10N.261.52.F10]AUR97291.1 hypothetical protein NVP1238A_42 [Vibrio phage 1.238.A._10N.261.52.F10]AUR97385.1 hypothetical protein NVP1238B_43 [Vibrio phage 1.238.B._10N.261.52.F10]